MELTRDDRLRAAAIRRLRLRRGWNLKETAKRFGYHVSVVSRWENKVRRPPTASQIAVAFGITEAEVLVPCQNCNDDPPPGFMCLFCGGRGME